MYIYVYVCIYMYTYDKVFLLAYITHLTKHVCLFVKQTQSLSIHNLSLYIYTYMYTHVIL